MSHAPNLTVPAHVPADLIRPYPFPDGMTTTENPFETLIPQVHSGPEVFYTVDGYHGMQGAWVFRKFKDLQAIYMDTENFSSKDFAPFAKMLGETWNLVPAESDPPAHTFHRQMSNPLFTPKRMAEMEAHVRQVARDAVASFKDKGECEFMADMAFELPIVVFLELMGLPLSDTPKFLAWEKMITHPGSIEEMVQGARIVTDYLREVINDRRKLANPGDDFIGYGLTAEMGGRKFNDDELLGFCWNLFIGGLDTVSSNMGLHFRHLAEHPEHQAELRAHPEKIPAAVEEFLRAYSAVNTARHVIKPVTINGVQLMPGDIVTMSTPLGNRDPEAFERVDEVILDRNPRHLTFATGIHRCVGAPLARRELVIAIEEMLANLPPFRIKPGAVVETSISAIIQLVSLPLVWDAKD